MFKYILFDLDGTLTEPKEGITKSVAYALSHFGINENPDDLTHFIGPPLIESFKRYYNFSEEDALEAVRLYRVRFGDVGKFENKVIDGIEQMLNSLKASGKILAVSSSKPEIFVKQILDKFELSKYFDFAVGATMDGSISEKADVIFETFKRMNLTESDLKNTVMVGDRLHDILGAHKCGIKCVGVKFGYAKENELEEYGADYISNTVTDLKEFLLK